MMIHKSQGGNFEIVVYDYTKAHPQKLVYVALSRVTTLQGLYLTNFLPPFYHHPSNPDNALVSEYERLNKHGLGAAYARCRALMTNPATVYTVALLNVRSLICHIADVHGDRLLTTADVLLFTEVGVATRSQAVTIPQFGMVAYASRVDATRSSGVCIYVRNEIAASELRNVAVRKGEACAVQLDESGVIIEAVYGSPNNSVKDTIHVVATSIPSRAASELCVVAGDFNRAPDSLCVPLKDTFNLDLASVPTAQETRWGSTIDLV
ncbi:hypothetical protein HPB51_005817 [Rhipicephalus microplus]|uniref:Endonuclease/exonuclease/phosphatase domain-containing protein n=1 Tax=Rhipicephalus microplus TaxID=6941 RepID=A0A9J6D8H5_RHIMP|nr:hypothetical protein HPB51_005817 [Rhipicephalus microplus]